MTRIEAQRAKVAQLYDNARNAGKEGWGTHRKSGDAGRVAALWVEAKRELKEMDAQERAEAIQDLADADRDLI
mgnify:FL=1